MRLWHAVQSKAQEESKAERHLQRQGFETFFPHVSDWVDAGGNNRARSRLVRRPWLTGYLFVKSEIEMLHLIPETPGVIGLLYGASDWPVTIPHENMLEMQDKADSLGEIYRPGMVARRFKGSPGDRIQIGENSKLWGFYAVIEKVMGTDMVVRLDRAIMGQERIIMPTAHVGEILKAG